MPPFAQHLDKARENLSFVAFLKSSATSYFDWMILAYFLAALHHVEAYFDHCFGKSYGSHYDRRQAIRMDARLSTFWNHYRALETYSQTARYGVKKFDQKYVDSRVAPHFQTLQRGIEGLASKLKL
jgi:hypothetical protein